MSELTHEENFIIEKLKERGGKLNYRELQTLCQDEFEGVRLTSFNGKTIIPFFISFLRS
ncbi:MAG: hypothetical protein ACFFA3_07520 [Promethearchaeota archaeon]